MGVEKIVLREGDGSNFPRKGQKLAMHYMGTLTNGTKFDSSYDRGQPFEFKIGKGEVIRGWDEGVSDGNMMPCAQRLIFVCGRLM